MKNEFSYLVLISSYLLRKGIIYLLNRLPGNINIIEIGEYDNIKDIEINNSIKAIIIEENLLNLFNAGKNIKIPQLVLHNNEKKTTQKQDLTYLNIDSEKTLTFETMLNFHKFILPKNHKDDSNELSTREKDIVRCIAQGKTNKEMAVELFISQHTVITHRKNITGKLGIKTVAGLTVYAILNGLVKMEEIKE
ncbi:MAG: helix-turn-helix transcriptional regulator [Bacteroidales bacterium]|nr:helix-turn-helix transcriptional regulator [Bacteroidales bacterium]